MVATRQPRNCHEILTLREPQPGLKNRRLQAETEMAKTPGRARFLMDVWGPAKAQADKDAEVLTQMMHEDGINGDLVWTGTTRRNAARSNMTSMRQS